MPQLIKKSTGFAGLFIYERALMLDKRGAFQRLYCESELRAFGVLDPIKQINHSRSALAGIVRGLHFQLPPYEEQKIIFCTAGSVYDVALDLRKESATYLKCHTINLSYKRPISIVIPRGFAHGYQSLTSDCELIYLHTESHHPSHEAGINPFDVELDINWPMNAPYISPRDANLPSLSDHINAVSEM